MNPETRFLAKVRKELEKIPGSWWVKIQQVAIRGTPDLLGVVRGRFIALEFKVGKNKATALQQFVLDKIEEAGGYAMVVTPENYTEILKEIWEIHNANSIRSTV